EEILEARGNVHLKRGNEYLKADFARYYMSTKWVFLQGNVIVRTGRDELKAEEAEFDLRSRVGWLKKGQIFMAGPHAYISGERINKHWGDVYTFQQAKLSTCDGEVPAWSLVADEAVVEIDGYARLTRSSFQVKDTPIAYTPFFLFPTKTSRQTGLLRPEFGRSTSKGVYYNQPFFWAINESSDLTVNEYFMERRGLMQGLEYRARPNSDTSFWLRGDWLYDKKLDDDDSRGDYSGDGLVRNNHQRFWLRGMLDTKLPDLDWRFKADLDFASDQYFLSEFKSSFSGFNRTREDLFTLFSRDLQERDRNRVSGFLLTREWARGAVAFSSVYEQDTRLGHGNRSSSDDETVQRLPQFDAFLYKGRLFEDFPLEFEASAQAVYMYRRSGTRGARYEIHPRLTLPLNSRYGSIIATAGLRYNIYDSSSISNTNSLKDDGPRQSGKSRTLPDFSIAGFTEFARVYGMDPAPLALTESNVGESRWMALRHSVQPRLEFRHIPNEYQEDNPRYTYDDRIEARTELVYSITNVLTAKTEEVVLEKDENGDMRPTLRTSYRDVARLRLEQSYDFREATRDTERDRHERRPFGDVFADLTIYPSERLSITTRNDWSPYVNALTRHQSGVNINFPEYGSVYIGYDLRRSLDEYKRTREEGVQYLRFGFTTAPVGPFTLSTYFSHDFKDAGNKETDISLAFNHQCFKIVGRVSVDPQEENYQLLIVLTGLGD
ncbi:LPS assembly protein LptD, partial [Desulfovibrio sp. OttesenSCG-928-A18]|nr:LPS assembly protein LptD [Desulfovibrio sp. OttesenSCG-928-A18]